MRAGVGLGDEAVCELSVTLIKPIVCQIEPWWYPYFGYPYFGYHPIPTLVCILVPFLGVDMCVVAL